MAGLVPASTFFSHAAKDVDARDKPGHDGEELPSQPCRPITQASGSRIERISLLGSPHHSSRRIIRQPPKSEETRMSFKEYGDYDAVGLAGLVRDKQVSAKELLD